MTNQAYNGAHQQHERVVLSMSVKCAMFLVLSPRIRIKELGMLGLRVMGIGLWLN